MRDWTPPARVMEPRIVGQRHHDCMAAFFIITGVSVFIVAILCALGIVNLLG